jgi:hypothetical protein
VVSSATRTVLVIPNFSASSCARGRIPSAKQAKGQRKMESQGIRSTESALGRCSCN